jgi:hypothetical protein
MNQTCSLQFVGGGLAHILSDVLQYASQTVVPGTLNGVYLGLFTAWPGFGLGLQMSQLTEPTFGGYARKAIAWGDQGIDKTQRPEVLGNLSQFQPSDSSASNSVIGAFVADASTNGHLIAVGLLQTPVTLGTPVDLLGVIPRFAVPGVTTPDWGEIVGID